MSRLFSLPVFSGSGTTGLHPYLYVTVEHTQVYSAWNEPYTFTPSPRVTFRIPLFPARCGHLKHRSTAFSTITALRTTPGDYPFFSYSAPAHLPDTLYLASCFEPLPFRCTQVFQSWLSGCLFYLACWYSVQPASLNYLNACSPHFFRGKNGMYPPCLILGTDRHTVFSLVSIRRVRYLIRFSVRSPFYAPVLCDSLVSINLSITLCSYRSFSGIGSFVAVNASSFFSKCVVSSFVHCLVLLFVVS